MAGLAAKPIQAKGLMRVVAPDDLSRQEAENNKPVEQPTAISDLAAYLRKQWMSAYSAKTTIQQRLNKCLRQRQGVYDDDKLAAIKEMGGSEVFMMLTNVKCRAIESWIKDIMLPPGGDKPWDIEATEIPELSPDIDNMIEQQLRSEAQQVTSQLGVRISPDEFSTALERERDQFLKYVREEAQSRAARMEKRIEEQLETSGWEDALRDFIRDVATFPTAIMRGPVFRREKAVQYAKINGSWTPIIQTKIRAKFYRVSPYDVYPSAKSRGVNDGYLFEHHRLRRKELLAMRGVPGYDDVAIGKVINEYGIGGLRDWLYFDQQRATLENRPNEWLAGDETIDALEYSGSIPGKLLMQWGVKDARINDPLEEYECNAWLIGPYVIRAVLSDHPLGERNYFTASFDDVPDSWWGNSPPEIMSDSQDVCNAAGRSLVNNMAMASGPMAEIHTDRLATGEDPTTMGPWRMFQMTADTNGADKPAIQFFQPNMNAEALMAVFQFFSKLADEQLSVPAYTYGIPETSGAGKTASGLSMLMTASARGIKQVVSNIDRPIRGTIKAMYTYNMLYSQDETIKGDVQCRARGSSSLIAKEQQQMRRTEFLQATANPMDWQIMGPKGRAELLRETVKSMELPVDKIIPDSQQLAQQVKQDAINALPQSQGAPGAAPVQQSQPVNPAGAPMGGQDAALFQQQAPPGP